MTTPIDTLLVDDDVAFCRAVQSYFFREGLQLATLTDSLAVTAIDLTNIKVLLLDLDMPKLNGRQILKQMPKVQNPLVIILSGHSDIDTRLDLLGNGADFFLSKPVNLAELCLIVKKALGRSVSVTDNNRLQWKLVKHQMCLFAPDNRKFGLSGAELRVLEKLFCNAGNPTKKEDLIEASSGYVQVPTLQRIRSLEVLLSRLRKRFSSDLTTFPLKSLRNVGYIFYGRCEVID